MEKITFGQLCETSNSWEKAVIVFAPESFRWKGYSEVDRSYLVSSKEEYFNKNTSETTLYGDCFNLRDKEIRLDLHMKKSPSTRERIWIVEYCYILK